MKAAPLIILLILNSCATAQTGASQTVEVGGHSYRVKVDGSSVYAFPKAVVSRRSPDEATELRAAIKIATGCGIEHEYWEQGHLAATLDCPK